MHGQIERYRAIKVLHQYWDLLLREAHECRILPRLCFLKELPQRLNVVDDLHIGIGPGEFWITEDFERDDVLLLRPCKHG